MHNAQFYVFIYVNLINIYVSHIINMNVDFINNPSNGVSLIMHYALCIVHYLLVSQCLCGQCLCCSLHGDVGAYQCDDEHHEIGESRIRSETA